MRTHTKWITLRTPIAREGQDEPIKALHLRRAKASDCMGLYLANILRMEGNAMLTLIPRLAEPYLTKEEIAQLDVADLVTISGELIGLFVDPEDAAELGAPATADQ